MHCWAVLTAEELPLIILRRKNVERINLEKNTVHCGVAHYLSGKGLSSILLHLCCSNDMAWINHNKQRKVKWVHSHEEYQHQWAKCWMGSNYETLNSVGYEMCVYWQYAWWILNKYHSYQHFIQRKWRHGKFRCLVQFCNRTNVKPRKFQLQREPLGQRKRKTEQNRTKQTKKMYFTDNGFTNIFFLIM